ncbi:hypothetical protein KKG19_00105, partial [Patescibacteria group bacterium]|nr:hypothetical protein [Patescibacteria group bacterium]
RGYLGRYITQDFTGTTKTAAEIIWTEAQRYQINPQFILALLQREQSLVQATSPTQKQLDWAMGYAICDDCSMGDPRLQKYKGFGKQVHWAAQKIREDYLTDLEATGTTLTGLGPGRIAVIDGRIVIPTNKATSVLYTYTPHLHGNENFVTIWNKWFRKDYPTGSLLQNIQDGGIWLIQFGKKRPITSRTAFYSRYNPNAVIQVPAKDLEAYEKGAPISFPNYSLLKSPNNSVYLLVDDTRRAIVSWEAFQKIGFNPDEIIEVTFEDLAGYHEGPVITVESANPQGVLMQNQTTGGVFLIADGQKAPLVSMDILIANFAGWPLNPVSFETLDQYPETDPVLLPDGTLVGMQGDPSVYVISEGQRRKIEDELTFLTYGYAWPNVLWTNEITLNIHPLGEDLTLTVEEPTELASIN